MSDDFSDGKLVEGRPQTKYSKHWMCPDCRKNYREIEEEIEVCYFELPEPETVAGMEPKDGALEVHCPCGTVYWMHIDIDSIFKKNNEVLVDPVERDVKEVYCDNWKECGMALDKETFEVPRDEYKNGEVRCPECGSSKIRPGWDATFFPREKEWKKSQLKMEKSKREFKKVIKSDEEGSEDG